MTARQQRASLRRLTRARTALAACTEEERATLVAELGRRSSCDNCASIATLVATHPRAAVGAAVGAVAAILLGPTDKSASARHRPSEPLLLPGLQPYCVVCRLTWPCPQAKVSP